MIDGFPGIARTATSRGVDVPVPGDDEAENLVAENLTTIRLVALSEDLAGADRRYRSSVGDWRETWQAVEDGGVIINEPMANRYDLEWATR